MTNYRSRYIVHGVINHHDSNDETTWTSKPMLIGQVAEHIKQVMFEEVYVASSYVFTVVACEEA